MSRWNRSHFPPARTATIVQTEDALRMLGGGFEVRLFDLSTSGLFGLGEFVIVRRTVLAGNVGLD